ncbi:NmrA-like family-containing protein 1 [Coleophoma cylindrospora]|uniref:NmrA-like family-containing protein 1 n=1 Tax=Coleophoma cylindrospora TaxID=1849047 RepID=A0A3D8R787_9HELO|nr:NmrA-like family-containing protein 1 [Coleophoma cylindrospora]
MAADNYRTTTIFIVGGTGAQGIPVVQGLVHDGRYSCVVLTRDPQSARAQELARLPKVTLLEGTFTSPDILRQGLAQCDGAFINIDGFNSGEKEETFWAMRIYELAVQQGIKFFVYGNLDFVTKKSGYDPLLKTAHYDGKGRVGEWILHQTRDNGPRMGAALFTTGPYIEMTIAAGTIMTPQVEDGVVTWRAPLGAGAVPHVALDDCAEYVRWLFDHAPRANGMDLEVAIDHIPYAELAAAFTRVTGHPARFIDTSVDEYWQHGPMAFAADLPAAYNDPKGPTIRENFTGFWNMWRASGQNQGVIRRDYALLDEIHPGRIKSAEQWFRRQEEKHGPGSLWKRVQPEHLKPVLKISEDRRKGKL